MTDISVGRYYRLILAYTYIGIGVFVLDIGWYENVLISKNMIYNYSILS